MYTLTIDQLIMEVDGASVVVERDLRNPVYLAWLSEVHPEPTPDVFVLHLQCFMDRRARELGYDDLKTAITYRGDPNPRFAAEAEAYFVWRSAVWTKAYELLAAAQAGGTGLPSFAQAVALLPALVLPTPEEPTA